MKGKVSVYGLILRLTGLLLCTLPVIACILSYFPIWVGNSSGKVLSGFAILLIAVAMIPFYKTVKRMLAGASVHTLWLIAFIIFFCLSEISDEMTVISFVGFIGNLLGAVCFRISRRLGVESEDLKNE